MQELNKREAIAAQLSYSHDGRWVPLPEWAQYLFTLGTIVSTTQGAAATKTVLAVALPTRAYAALLLATGVVLGRSIDPAGQGLGAEHFEMLCDLPIGTALIYSLDDQLAPAVFEGRKRFDVEDKVRIGVRIQKRAAGAGTLYLDGHQARAVQVRPGVDGEEAFRKRLPRLTGTAEARSRNQFLENLISPGGLTDFLTQPRLDTRLIGIANTLHKEVGLQLMSTGHAGRGEGTLQDLIRCRRFLSDGHAYRTDLTPSSASQLSQQFPYATVFDGALAYLRCRDECRGTHQIIALDRSAAHFHDATSIINQAYLNRANSDTLTLPSLAGIETLIFEEYQP